MKGYECSVERKKKTDFKVGVLIDRNWGFFVET